MPGSRRLSHRISEGEGIAIIASVRDAEAARAAEAEGAKALAVDRPVEGIREATTLPVLWCGNGHPGEADAYLVRAGSAAADGLEAVADVRDKEELQRALEELDPEILLLGPRREDDPEEALASVLELLPDVPAGKLAIARVDVATREEVDALERAGFDAVLVGPGHVAALVGAPPPAV